MASSRTASATQNNPTDVLEYATIPAFRRWELEDQEFKAGLSNQPGI